jgi:hexulose-6-phosphate isomerase
LDERDEALLKGICLGSLAGATLQEKLELAKKAGFDAVELGNLNERGTVTPSMTDDQVRALLPLFAATVPAHGMFAGDAWSVPLTAPDSAVRQRGLDLMYRSVDVAVLLGMSSLLIVPGAVNDDVAYDQAYEWAQEALRKLAQRAKGSGLLLGIENVGNKMLLSPLETARFIDEIGDPDFGAYFDVGNILGTGYPDQWIRILGQRIKRIHVKDRKAGPTGGGMPLLAGDVPWDRVMRELRAIGYDSYLTAEIGTFKHHAAEGAWQISRSLDALIGAPT